MAKKDDLRYTLNRLYECRNLEISHLWQRSVFLSVFLILCFSAYGYLALELISKQFAVFPDTEQQLLTSTCCLFIVSVGVLFSVVWILMAKGSKAWYEVYETAIHEFENHHFAKLKLPYDNIMGNMWLDSQKINNSIMSSKSGAYSPSRINIAIGQISLILWIIFGVFHIGFNFTTSEKIDKYCIAVLLISVFCIIVSVTIIRSKYLRSSFLG